MGRFDDARLLLDRSRDDLQALAGMLDAAQFSNSVFGFHAQQAVEKAAKAWLIALGRDVERSHDLRPLLKGLSEFNGRASDDWASLADLNDFAVQYRYGAGSDSAPLSRLAVLGQVGRFVKAADIAVSRIAAI